MDVVFKELETYINHNRLVLVMTRNRANIQKMSELLHEDAFEDFKSGFKGIRTC